MILHVICIAFERVIPLRGLIDSFINQTDPNWDLHIIHDGRAPIGVHQVMNLYKEEPRITFEETANRYGNYGHPNRREGLKQCKGAANDYVLITNDDNYYIPKFVEYFLRECTGNVGMAYCNTIHSYFNYDIMFTRIEECHVDMGSFVVRLDVAQAVGFNHNHHSADGRYAVDCANYCDASQMIIKYIDKPLFVHN